MGRLLAKARLLADATWRMHPPEVSVAFSLSCGTCKSSLVGNKGRAVFHHIVKRDSKLSGKRLTE